MNYYDKQEALVRIARALESNGFELHGFHEDDSDSMTDYFSPASWHGIAVKDGFIISASYGEQKAHDITTNHTQTMECPQCNGSCIEPGSEEWTLTTARANPEGFHSWDDKNRGDGGVSMLTNVVSPLLFNDDGTRRCQKCSGTGTLIDHTKTTKEVVGYYPAHKGHRTNRVQFHLEKDGKILKEWFALKPYWLGYNDYDDIGLKDNYIEIQRILFNESEVSELPGVSELLQKEFLHNYDFGKSLKDKEYNKLYTDVIKIHDLLFITIEATLVLNNKEINVKNIVDLYHSANHFKNFNKECTVPRSPGKRKVQQAHNKLFAEIERFMNPPKITAIAVNSDADTDLQIVKHGKVYALLGNSRKFAPQLGRKGGIGLKFIFGLNRPEGKEPGWLLFPEQIDEVAEITGASKPAE